MRCHEARNRIDALDRRSGQPLIDLSLRDHLNGCQDCRDYLTVSGNVDRIFDAARTDSPDHVKPMAQLRSEVEARLGHTLNRRLRDAARASLRMARPFYGRPAFRLSLATVAVVLGALALIPFEYYQTVGYDLNLQGVSRHLGHSDEQICELLTGLGLVEAGVELKGCDSTCSLAIFDLKTENEARLVAGAIARMGEPDMTTSIVPVRTRSTRSLLEQANNLILHSDS